jgi:hypothetical protein
VLNVVYALGFNYLYLNIYIKDKMEFCGQFLDQFGVCKGVAYIIYWVSETPLLIVSFMIVALTLHITSRYLVNLKFKSRYVVISYIVFYLAIANFSEYSDELPLVSWYNFGVSIYHGVLFMMCLCLAKKLTNQVARH